MTALVVCFLALLAFFYAHPLVGAWTEKPTVTVTYFPARLNETVVPKTSFRVPLPEANPRR